MRDQQQNEQEEAVEGDQRRQAHRARGSDAKQQRPLHHTSQALPGGGAAPGTPQRFLTKHVRVRGLQQQEEQVQDVHLLQQAHLQVQLQDVQAQRLQDAQAQRLQEDAQVLDARVQEVYLQAQQVQEFQRLQRPLLLLLPDAQRGARATSRRRSRRPRRRAPPRERRRDHEGASQSEHPPGAPSGPGP